MRRGDWAAWGALALGAAGVGGRLALLLNDSPPTNSDEAANGLAAMHIAAGREFPVFFYGQHYMGTVVPYLAAPLFKLFEPSTFLLRVPTLLLYAVFLVLMFRLSRRLFSPAVAVLTVGYLAFGADRWIKNELIGGGGYPETNPMLAGLFLIGLGLAQRTYRREAWAFATWGLLFGLVVWTHWVAMPYLLGAAVLIARRLMGRMGLWALAGALLGAGPLIWDNLVASAEHSSIATFVKLISAGGDPGLSDRLHGGVIVGMPLASGLCPAGYCAPVQLWWGPVYLLLMGTAAVWAWRRRATPIMLLIGAAGLTIVLYAISSGAAESPMESARYLHYLLVSTPVWIWVLWRLAAGALGQLGRVAAVATLAAVTVLALTATVSLARRVPDYAAWARQTEAVSRDLRALGVTHVYGGYWTCNLLTFSAREEVICAVVHDDLSPGFNRYSSYWNIVESQPDPVPYLVLAASDIAAPESRLDAAIRGSGQDFVALRLGGYRLYLPQGHDYFTGRPGLS